MMRAICKLPHNRLAIWHHNALFIGLFFLLASCGGLPQLHILDRIDVPLQADEGRVLYVTDRVPDETRGAGTVYGHGRSASMAFGHARLNFGAGSEAGDISTVKVGAVSEQLRFPATPLPFSQRGGIIVPDKQAQDGYAAVTRDFKAQIIQALRDADQDEVALFVHGFNNGFDDAVIATANIWEASGRSVVPITYTWPADNPGIFGYFKDRESGEFSIFHLKETLRLLSEIDEIKKIQVIAHSRGTDVATTALREIIIAVRAAGKNPRTELKIDNLILAAPDLDFDVVRQRLLAERFAPAFECITVYMNPNDGALAFAQQLNSGIRFGRLSYEDLGEVERKIFAQTGNIYFVDVSGVVARRGHSYFRENPVVLSDIVALLHTSATPGDPLRNMTHIEANFWMLEQPRGITGLVGIDR